MTAGATTVRRALLAALCSLALAGCSDHEFHPPDEEARVVEARQQYQQARFDTITWSSTEERIQAGNLVFADECRRCHGALGQGETDYSRRNDIAVPSLVRPDWELGDDLDGIRRRIYVGHAAGMPNWGVGKLTERQIDAAAFYLLEQLRPEVLGDSVPERP